MAGRYFAHMDSHDLNTTHKFYSQRKLLREADARGLHAEMYQLHLQKEDVDRHFNGRWNRLGPTFQNRGQGHTLQKEWADTIRPIETLMRDKHAELVGISNELYDIRTYLEELNWRIRASSK